MGAAAGRGIIPARARRRRTTAFLNLLSFNNGLRLVQTANNITQSGIVDANALNAAVSGSTYNPTFSNTTLASQLKMVARIINVHQALGASRQIFFVSMGGFDNHQTLLNVQDTNLTRRVSDSSIGHPEIWSPAPGRSSRSKARWTDRHRPRFVQRPLYHRDVIPEFHHQAVTASATQEPDSISQLRAFHLYRRNGGRLHHIRNRKVSYRRPPPVEWRCTSPPSKKTATLGPVAVSPTREVWPAISPRARMAMRHSGAYGKHGWHP